MHEEDTIPIVAALPDKPPPTKPRRRGMKSTTKEALTGYAFIAPNFIGFLLFTLVPVAIALVLAFSRWDILTPPEFVGLRNFIELLGFHQLDGQWHPNDPDFWHYLYNTIFLMSGIPISMLGSLVLAALLMSPIRGRTFFRTIYFMPTIASGVALIILWRWLYATDSGLINAAIARIGDMTGLPLQGIPWLTSTTWSKPSLIIMAVWGGIGGMNMILYMAALTGIPRQLYEAAEIDGAGVWHKFWHITWPMVSPTTFFIGVMSIISGFQGGFMAAYVMTRGGPAGSTTTIEYYIYTTAYEQFRMGYASAVAWVLFAMVFVITLLYWKFGGKRVTY